MLPVVLAVLTNAVAGNNFVLRAQLSNSGFLLQMAIFSCMLWSRRASMTGNGWKVMLVAVLIQSLSVLPLALMGRPSTAADGGGPQWVAALVPWVICMVMFLNLQVSALAFLMMLKDRQTERERLAAEIDVLTALPNRRSLERSLASFSLDSVKCLEVGILLLDVDHFKHFNDRFGHAEGDRVLQHVARLLRRQLREGDLVARYGGEEFVVILPQASAQDSVQVAQRIVEAIAQAPVDIAGSRHRVTVSVGVHVQRLPGDLPDEPAGAGPNWNALIRKADIAMYEAKRAGRNRFVVLQEEQGAV